MSQTLNPQPVETLAAPSSGRHPWLAVCMALAFGLLLTCMVSEEPIRAYRALLSGALPDITVSWDAGIKLQRLTRFGAVLEDTVTLTLLGLAMVFGLRARQFSMGADGQLFLSALAAAWVSVQLSTHPALALPLAAVAAVATGFVWGWIPGTLKARWDANEIVTTLMLNVIAIQFYRLVITSCFRDPAAGYLATPSLAAETTFSSLIAHTNVTVFAFIAPAAAALAWFVLNRTALGYEIRAVGDSHAFARQCGIPVRRTIVMAMAMGGAFAGLAGLHLSNALLKRLPADLTPGIGFEGLVVALLARNDPKNVVLAAFLYAYLKAGALAMERASDVSREMVLVIQALIVLFVVCERFISSSAMRGLLARLRAIAARFTTGGPVA